MEGTDIIDSMMGKYANIRQKPKLYSTLGG